MIYLVNEKNPDIQIKLIKNICKKFNFSYSSMEKFDFMKTKIDEFKYFCNKKSLISKSRILLVSNFKSINEIFDKEDQKYWIELDQIFSEYSKNKDNHIIFLSESSLKTQNKNLSKHLIKIEVEVYSNKKIFEIAKMFLEKNNIEFTHEAIDFLLQAINFDVIKLENELKKIRLLEIRKIDINFLRELLFDQEKNIWEIINFLVKGDLLKFVKKYNSLNKEGINEILITKMILNNLLNVKMIKLLEKNNYPRDAILKKLNINFFQYNNFIKSSINNDKLNKLIQKLEEILINIKFNNSNPKIEFLSLIII